MRVRIGMMTAFAVMAFVPVLGAQESEAPREAVQDAREETRDNIQEARDDIREEREDLREQRREVAEERREDRREEREVRQSTTNPMWRTAMKAQDMQQSMAACLNLSNHAEIELADLALAKSQNPEVKKFAQKMKEDHSAAIEELKQFIPQVENATPKATENSASGEEVADQNATASAAQVKKAKQFHNPMLLLMQEIAKNELSMTKDVLSKYEGQDFDMGYLGQQIVAHTQMLAKLHAMKDRGSPKFNTVAQNMIKTVEEHFTMANELARKFEDKERGSASEAQQTSTPAVRENAATATTTN